MPVAEFSGEAHLVEPLVPSTRMLRAFQTAFGNDRPADDFRTSSAARVNKYREMVMVNDVVMWNTLGGSVEVGKVLCSEKRNMDSWAAHHQHAVCRVLTWLMLLMVVWR